MSGAEQVTLSIVIPVGPGDSAWVDLLPRLQAQSPAGTEIVISAAETPPNAIVARVASPSGPALQWIEGSPGRGRQLNRGAVAARGRYLWFLHADAWPEEEAIPTLLRRLRADEGALWYFDLQFLDDGPRLVKLNELGARLRSRVLGLPFGDQGFALARPLFERLGGFLETAEYGEDHLFVWAARHAAVPVRPIGLTLRTSARKYARRGWLATTLTHLRLTWQQAVPEMRRSSRARGTP